MKIDYMKKIKDHSYECKSTGCWIWKSAVLGSWDTNRRPTIRIKNTYYTVTRAAWELDNNEKFPEDLQAGHMCEGSSPLAAFCVNPAHIVPVTAAENETMKVCHITDKYAKSQKKYGGQPARMKGTWSQKEKVDWILKNEVKEVDEGYLSPCLVSKTSTRSGYWRKTWKVNKIRVDQRVHRLVAAEKHLNVDYTDIPEGVVIRHLCHNKKCVNPEHLIPGTMSENNLDSRSYHSNTDLTYENVLELLNLWKQWLNHSTVKKHFWQEVVWPKFGITFSGTTAILYGRNWKDAYAEVFPQGDEALKLKQEKQTILQEKFNYAVENNLWVYGKKKLLKAQWADELDLTVRSVEYQLNKIKRVG